MALYYPPINSAGMLIQMPYKRGFNFGNKIEKNPYARPYSYAEISGGLNNYPSSPLASFQLTYSSVTDAEKVTIRNFVQNVAMGSLNPFSYIDPMGNLVTASENFSDASWTVLGATVGAAQTDPYLGQRATLLTGTTSNAYVKTTVIPTGSVAGFWFTFSIWLKATASYSLQLSFVEAGTGNTLASNTVQIGTAWKRYSVSFQSTSTAGLLVQFGGSNTWSSYALTAFAAQCVALPGAGNYLRSPASVGLHAKCRFDTDSFKYTYAQRNQTQVVLPIQEIF